MRLSPTFALLLALVALFLVPPARSSAPAPEDERTAQFKEKYRQAEAIGAFDEMAKIMREYEWEAIVLIVGLCERLSDNPTAELEREIASYNKTWKRGYQTAFVDNLYAYFSLLDPNVKRERALLRDRYTRNDERYLTNLNGKKDGPEFTIVAAEFELLGQAFGQIGDLYYSSESWLRRGTSFETGVRGPDADLVEATLAYEKGLEARRQLGLEDKRYREVRAVFDQYVKKGYLKKPADDEGGGGGGEAPPVAAGTGIEVPLAFDPVDDLARFERPNFIADEIYTMWPVVALKDKGTTAAIPGPEAAPRLVRVGSGDVRVDQDNDGKGESPGEEKIAFTGQPALVRMTLDAGKATEREWAIVATIGLEKDEYQGIEVNAAPGDGWFSVYVAPGASVIGTVEGVPVRLLDDNMNGVYGDAPVDWGHTGITEGHFQHDMDAIVVGGEKRARPWSKLQRIGEKWYSLEVQDKGKQLVATPVEVKTGKLKLALDGPPASWLVVRGRGQLADCYFDVLADGAGGAELPVGDWELFQGEIRVGKKRQTMKALVLPDGKLGPVWEVDEGKTTKAELGAPFGFDFRYEADEKTVRLIGASVTVTGAHGERYERIWGAVPKPEVSWREKGSKRGSKPEKTETIGDQFKLNELGWAAAWKPLDVILEHEGAAEVELQLASKKNKLFGKITSDWK